MTAAEWKQNLGANTEIGICGSLYHDLAACEAERDSEHEACAAAVRQWNKCEAERDDLRCKLEEMERGYKINLDALAESERLREKDEAEVRERERAAYLVGREDVLTWKGDMSDIRFPKEA